MSRHKASVIISHNFRLRLVVYLCRAKSKTSFSCNVFEGRCVSYLLENRNYGREAGELLVNLCDAAITVQHSVNII